MATETTTTTTTAPEATPAPEPATDLSALTMAATEEPAEAAEDPKNDDANDTSSDQEQSKKRSSSDADLKDGAPPTKITKRRAARACVSCRARKVRCDVVEGAPCGNCRWDNVECVVQESRRRKKNLLTASTAGHHGVGAEAQLRSKGANPINIHSSAELRRPSNASLASVNGSIAANPVPASSGVPLNATSGVGAGAAAAAAGSGSVGGNGIGVGIGPGVLGGLSVPGGSSDGIEGHVPHMICKFASVSVTQFFFWPCNTHFLGHLFFWNTNFLSVGSLSIPHRTSKLRPLFVVSSFLFLVLPIAAQSGGLRLGEGTERGKVWRGVLDFSYPVTWGLSPPFLVQSSLS
ncbi:uncharacterized protein BDZ83DRAFT_23704 [Colletotrichum acutatum]|uniref:Zn(2)-C6 fungal-type domain-containing protein n=1 Tax=Glomerella acutata TaxID=27357 RepID=A0AAD8UBH8_GLOAC|nr:uncharacterized protein BDZ83DRAFT_23704 [Colletotrichum acutatum]KAK1717489.1 hypothetical protein BDZ83DRAFT_23704 [Colletotrichum acutatum]